MPRIKSPEEIRDIMDQAFDTHYEQACLDYHLDSLSPGAREVARVICCRMFHAGAIKMGNVLVYGVGIVPEDVRRRNIETLLVDIGLMLLWIAFGFTFFFVPFFVAATKFDGR